MVLTAGLDLPARAIREQVASAINVIVQLNRFRDGSRKVTHVTEIAGMEGNVVTMQDIFRFEQEGVDDGGRVRGRFMPTGLRSQFDERLRKAGIVLPSSIYEPVESWS